MTLWIRVAGYSIGVAVLLADMRYYNTKIEQDLRFILETNSSK
jgi:hypothetical protein